MRRQTISLDGDWERRDFLDEAWRWSDAIRPAEAAAESGPPASAGISAGWRRGRVPGSTIDDAWRAGEIPNPYVDRNSLDAEWVPARTWVYRRSFEVPRRDDTGAVLRFEGIDPGGTILLDGEEVGRHDGMFLPLEVDLSGRLAPGRHVVAVALAPAPPMPSQVGRSEEARLHRSRMTYGWDFCPRMIHTGIWRSVSLELFRRRIADVHLEVRAPAGSADAEVRMTCRLDGTGAGRLVARIVGPAENVVAEAGTDAADDSVELTMTVRNAVRWSPNGQGSPALHRLELELRDGDEIVDARDARFGIRSVELAPNVGAAADARPYTFVVNGRPTWIRGWNWVPVDAAYGVPAEDRVRHLVELARRANVNMLRVWGGGLIESEMFYDACDEAGIMVWQEFTLSSSGISNAPPTDGGFVELMRREAEALVPMRSRHPSLVSWCGGNELADERGPLDERHPALAALRDVVSRLDPTRAWLPSSPSGPRFDNSLAAIADDPASLHDVHGPWEHQRLGEQHALANATTSLLHTEFGAEGLTNVEALEATVTPPAREPLDRSNPVMAHRGAWWNNAPFVREAFGGEALDLERMVRASQLLQADGLRTLVEGDRRRWPRNAGALPWQLNEPFPNAWCTSAVDAFGTPKAAYHAVAETYAPVAIGLAFASQALAGANGMTVEPWVANDTDAPLAGTLEITLRDPDGRRLDTASASLAVQANAVGEAGPLRLGVPDDAGGLLVLDAVFAGAWTRRLLGRGDDLGPMLALGATAVTAALDVSGDRWTIRLANDGSCLALAMRLADARPVGWPERIGHAYLDRNFVSLLPGEACEIGVDWIGVPVGDRGLVLEGWNVDRRVIPSG